MTVERLISALWTEAEVKERALMDEARERAAQITAQREEAVARLDERIAARRARIAADEAALVSARTRMRRRRAGLQAMDAAMRMVRDKTEALFREFMRSPDYARYLARQMDVIRKETGAVAEIRADELTADELTKAGVSNVTADPAVENGFIATVVGGDARVFCLFSTKFEKLWRAVAPSIVARLAEAMPHGD